jgi:enoyl-CoA hydratase/carnithine racemase
MDTYEAIRVEVDAPVATVVLSRPAALNAITPLMLDELHTAFTALGSDPDVTVVVLTGEGRAFSAGVDLKAIGEMPAEGGGQVGGSLNDRARRLISLLATLDAIVIAKVNGHCFTGALELALACDLVVTADEATFGDTHAKWGLRPTWGMSQRLPRAVGPARARELSYTARTFSGVEAAAWGLAVRSCPRAALDDQTADLAATIAANSRGSLLAYKDLYRVADEVVLAEGLAYEEANEYVIEDTASRVGGFR